MNHGWQSPVWRRSAHSREVAEVVVGGAAVDVAHAVHGRGGEDGTGAAEPVEDGVHGCGETGGTESHKSGP
jgi:hypothetical protein